jgi:hypothetical protein
MIHIYSLVYHRSYKNLIIESVFNKTLVKNSLYIVAVNTFD